MNITELQRPGIQSKGFSGLTPEDRLIRDCVRAHLNPACLAELDRALDTPVDWDYLLRSAHRHCVVPLINRSLPAVVSEQIPDDVGSTLQRITQRTQQLNLMKVGELFHLLSHFAQRQISVLPWKGPVLAYQAYGDFGVRQFADLDLLIHKRDFPAARQMLIELGYEPHLPLRDPTDIAAFPYRNDHEYRLERAGMLVELQWQVLQRPFAFPPDADRWWDQLQPIDLAGRQVLAMPVEQLLLILCVHGSKHLWDRLIWLCDVAALLQKNPQIDWETLLATARALGAERMLLIGLHMVHNVLGTELPSLVLEKIAADPQVAALARVSTGQLFRQTEAMPAEVVERMPLYRFWMMGRLRDRLRIAVQHSRVLLNPARVLRVYGFEPIRRLLGI